MANSILSKDTISISATTPSNVNIYQVVHTGTSLYGKYVAVGVAYYMNYLWVTKINGNISTVYVDFQNNVYMQITDSSIANLPCRILFQRI